MTRHDSIPGRIIRLPLRLIPRNTVVRVRSGLNKGFRWRVGSATHGCWLGHYEQDVQRALPEHVRQGMVCYDIGANAGFYSLALARLVGPAGRVIAFEPAAENAANLLQHIRMNDLSRVSLVQAAVGDSDKLVPFETHQSPSMGRVKADAVTGYFVPSIQLDTIIASERLPGPNFIKMDVEGAELVALRGAEVMLTKQRPILLISFHGAEIFRGCLNLLESNGYSISDLENRPVSARDQPVADVIAISPCQYP